MIQCAYFLSSESLHFLQVGCLKSLEAAASNSYGFANQHCGVFSKLQVSCEAINCFELVNEDMASPFFFRKRFLVLSIVLIQIT